MEELRRYRYEGPVMSFGKCIQDRYVGETYAESPAKAKSNISYRWKKKNNRTAGTKITLPGDVVAVD